VIQLKQVDKFYGQQQALRAVDLNVQAGECVVLIGPSGCGKSTLLKAINRMVSINAGQVLVEGKDVESYQPELLRRQIGYCIQGVGLFPHLTVKDNIAVVPRLLKWQEKTIDERIERLMTMSDLPLTYLHKKPHELSGGESQRVGVCRALAADPPILLMDEPFGAVDPLTREKLQVAFNYIQQLLKKTVVFVTHDVEEAIVLGDRIAVMNKGEILACKTPGELSGTSEDAFVKTFLGNEYPIRLLKRYTYADLSQAVRDAALLTEDLEDTKRQLFKAQMSLTSTTTVKEILSELMRRNLMSLTVETPDGQLDTVSYSDIVSLLHQVSRP